MRCARAFPPPATTRPPSSPGKARRSQPAELPDYLGRLRAVRINMEFNGALCRGLKEARYREKPPRTRTS